MEWPFHFPHPYAAMVLHSRRRDPFSPNARFFSNENYGIVKGDATAAILSDGGYRSYNAGKLARNFLNSCLLFHLWSEQDFGLSSCVFVRYHVPCGLAYFWQCSSIPVLLKRTITRISYRTIVSFLFATHRRESAREHPPKSEGAVAALHTTGLG